MFRLKITNICYLPNCSAQLFENMTSVISMISGLNKKK